MRKCIIESVMWLANISLVRPKKICSVVFQWTCRANSDILTKGRVSVIQRNQVKFAMNSWGTLTFWITLNQKMAWLLKVTLHQTYQLLITGYYIEYHLIYEYHYEFSYKMIQLFLHHNMGHLARWVYYYNSVCLSIEAGIKHLFMSHKF